MYKFNCAENVLWCNFPNGPPRPLEAAQTIFYAPRGARNPHSKAQGHLTCRRTQAYKSSSRAWQKGRCSLGPAGSIFDLPATCLLSHSVLRNSLQDAAHSAVSECQRQMRADKWNCSVQEDQPTLFSKGVVHGEFFEHLFIESVEFGGVDGRWGCGIADEGRESKEHACLCEK